MGGYAIDYVPSSSNLTLNTPFRVSGFTFNMNSKGAGIKLRHVGSNITIQTKVQIDNNHFLNTYGNTQAIWVRGIRGVIHNNTFDGIAFPLRFAEAGDVWGRTWWNNWERHVYGQNDTTMWIENNTFNDVTFMVADCNYGNRYAVRYNTINFTGSNGAWPMFDMHGGDTLGYGCFGTEIYGNQINDVGNYGGRLYDHRGGTAVVFNNNITTPGSMFNIQVREEYADSLMPVNYVGPNQPQVPIHVSDSYFWGNRKNLTGTLSGVFVLNPGCSGCNPGFTPAANVDFWVYTPSFTGASGVGAGTLANRPTTCTTGVGYWATNQSVTNLTGMVGTNPSTPISGTFYKCTTTNTWTSYFTPLTYPHPLTLASSPTYQCSDSIDNDSDGLTDYPNDPGCSSLTDNDEYNAPVQNFLPEQYIQAESGQLTSTQTGTSGSDTYIYTNTDNTGSAKYTFDISTSGQYKLEARVNSNNDGGQNSFYVGLDNESAQGNALYIYNIIPLITGFVWDEVSKWGNGTTSSQFDPMIWDLTQGTHSFTFYGRESNTWLDQIILRKITADTTPPSAPSGVIVI
ncbi:MAG: hypothetical protein AAB405_00710 [Patescibacteria group bacterium]